MGIIAKYLVGLWGSREGSEGHIRFFASYELDTFKYWVRRHERESYDWRRGVRVSTRYCYILSLCKMNMVENTV